MASRTATFDRSFATQAWSLTSAPLKVWSILVMLHEAYGEAMNLASKAQRNGVFVE